MIAAQNRFKQDHAPEGLSPAAHSLPEQAGTGRRGTDSGGDLSSAVHVVTSVGAI